MFCHGTQEMSLLPVTIALLHYCTIALYTVTLSVALTVNLVIVYIPIHTLHCPTPPICTALCININISEYPLFPSLISLSLVTVVLA